MISEVRIGFLLVPLKLHALWRAPLDTEPSDTVYPERSDGAANEDGRQEALVGLGGPT